MIAMFRTGQNEAGSRVAIYSNSKRSCEERFSRDDLVALYATSWKHETIRIRPREKPSLTKDGNARACDVHV